MESGLHSPDPPAPTGGLIVMVRPEPGCAARALAGDLHADVAVGGVETEAALRRLDAAAACGQDLDLDSLTAAMRRAEGVLDRTRRAASQRLSASLNTRLAIHPLTIRRVAGELVDAVHTVKAAEEAQRQARVRRQRFGIVTVLVALAAAAITAGLRPGWGLAAAVAAFLVVLGWAILTREPSDRRFTPTAPALLDELATAHRRWVQVGGAGVNPTDVDAVIHRYDPQDDVVANLADEHPAVRAAERVVAARRRAWVAAWEAKIAASPDDGDASVDVRVHIDLADPAAEAPASMNGHGKPGVDGLLRRDGAVLWLPEAPNDPTGPASLVLAMPYEDLPDDRARAVHTQLLALPAGERVLVVLAPEPTIAPRTTVPVAAKGVAALDQSDEA